MLSKAQANRTPRQPDTGQVTTRQVAKSFIVQATQMLATAHAWIYNHAATFLKTTHGKQITIGVFAFATGAFIAKLAVINDWFNLICFLMGACLAVGATLMAVYWKDIS